MPTFTGQVNTLDVDLDVTIVVDDGLVTMRSADGELGVWRRSECRFEQTNGTRFRLHVDDESVDVSVDDAPGFLSAVELLRRERVPLVPQPLLWMGTAAVIAAFATAWLSGSSPSAEAEDAIAPPSQLGVAAAVSPSRDEVIPEPDSESPAPSAIPQPVPPAEVATTVRETVEASTIIARWNDVAGRTEMILPTTGTTTFPGGVAVSVTNDLITVSAEPSGDGDQSRRLIAAMGLAVAAMEPSLSGPERGGVLEELGIDIDGANQYAIDHAIVVGDTAFTLDYQPGHRIRFSAGVEW
jgi:hypothetical protein